MRSERAKGFPFNSRGLGAGGVFTDFFRHRPSEGPMKMGSSRELSGGKRGEGIGRGVFGFIKLFYLNFFIILLYKKYKK